MCKIWRISGEDNDGEMTHDFYLLIPVLWLLLGAHDPVRDISLAAPSLPISSAHGNRYWLVGEGNLGLDVNTVELAPGSRCSARLRRLPRLLWTESESARRSRRVGWGRRCLRTTLAVGGGARRG